MTECSETLFPFEAHFSRQVVAQFAGDWLTTVGGSLLLRQADRKIGLLRRVAGCFTDYRQPERIEHRLAEMLAQRIYGLALGYEDLNDHEQLRQDPLLGVLAGKRDLGEPLAGKSTLNRLELTPVGSPAAERYNKISLWFAKTSAGTKNRAVLGRVGLNTIIARYGMKTKTLKSTNPSVRGARIYI